jgi:tripartite-type tricarboxylate transporter receptor subunit TctC
MHASSKISFVVGMVAALLPAAAATDRARAEWPTRPVTVIVPLAAGGNTDMMARLGAERLSEKFGQPFVIENRPSAGGAIAVGQVANAPPDGYTMLFAPSSMLLLTPMLQKVNFDVDKQLVPITNVGTGAQVLAIKRDLPATTLAEFIAFAKANPGKLNFVTAGTQNISQLAPALLLARAGIDMVMVPAKGGPQAVSDLMSGQVDMYFGNASELLPHAKSDRIRLIAAGTAHRLAAAPDLPVVAETFPDFVLQSWNGFVVPAGTPDDIVEAIRGEISAFARLPATANRLINLGIVPGGLTRDEVAAVFKADRKIFAEAMKAAGLGGP